jgi:hypothetical protein
VPIVAALATLAITWWIHIRILAITGGAASYPVDDAYIHLAIGKSLAFAGTYGVTPGTFTSASSSIAWPYIVAGCMRIVGDDPWIALYLNLAFGVCVPFALDALLAEFEVASRTRVVAIGVALFLGPLPTLITVGMEHTLHALLVLLFLREVVRPHSARTLCALALLCTSVRYESLLLIGFVALRMIRAKQWRDAALLVTAGVLPVLLFGAFLHAHDHPWLPLSVTLKGLHIETAGDLFSALLPLRKLSDNRPTALVGVAAVCAYLRARGPAQTVLGLLLATLLAQCVVGQLGWFYRYDAYLVMPLALCSVAALARDVRIPDGDGDRNSMRGLGIAGILLLLGAAPRGLYALRTTAAAAGNIHGQQVQTAHFLAKHFPEERVLVNDIGAVSYYRRGPMTDLMGLANRDVAEARGWRIDRPLPVAALARFSEGADVAVIYDEWFRGALPAEWTKVATWTIPNNRVCAFPSVAIYATRESAETRLREAVTAFERQLPPRVIRAQ